MTDHHSSPQPTDEQLLEELSTLMVARLTEEIAPEQLARLEYLVINDGRARRIYANYVQQTALLHQRTAQDAGVDHGRDSRDLEALKESLLAQRIGALGTGGQSVIDYPGTSANHLAIPTDATVALREMGLSHKDHRTTSPKTYLAALIAFSVLGLLAGLIFLVTRPADPVPVAMLTDTRHAVWLDQQGRRIFLAEGKPLLPQMLRLAEGIASVRFNNDMVVLLDAREKPTDFQLSSASSSFLRVGKIVAKAETERARGFTIDLPGNRSVVDLGTEFGVLVYEDGLSEVQVISGTVEAMRHDDRGNVLEKSILSTAKGALLGLKDSPIEAIEISETQFETAFEKLFAVALPQGNASGDSRAESTQPSGKLIKSLRVNSSHPYRIAPTAMAEDVKAYSDRDYQWNGLTSSGIPAYLLGGEYVMTAMWDKASMNLSIQLELRENTSLYVLFDDRCEPPAWLTRDFNKTPDAIGADYVGTRPSSLSPPGITGYTKLGIGAGNSVDNQYSIWKHRSLAGGKFTLGPPSKKQVLEPGMYSIVAVEADRNGQP